MGLGKRLNQEEIEKIKFLKAEGCTSTQIARKIKRSLRVVNNYIQDPENYGKRQKGCTKQATSEAERLRILELASNTNLTARQIRDTVGITASIRTIQRILRRSLDAQPICLTVEPDLIRKRKIKSDEEEIDYKTILNEWKMYNPPNNSDHDDDNDDDDDDDSNMADGQPKANHFKSKASDSEAECIDYSIIEIKEEVE